MSILLCLLMLIAFGVGCAKQQVPLRKDQMAANIGDDNGYTPLIRASWQGNLTDIDYWLRRGSRINQADHAGMTAIMHAATQCEINAFRLLKKSGADLTRKDVANRSVLHHAARGGCRDLLRYLVSNDNVLDGADSYGRTPLMLAAHNHHDEAVRVLLDIRAQPSLRDNNGRTALYHAAEALDEQDKRVAQAPQNETEKKATVLSEESKPPFFQRVKGGMHQALTNSWAWMKRSAKTIGRGIKKGTQASWAYITRPPWKPKTVQDVPIVEEIPPDIVRGSEEQGERVITLLLKAGADPEIPDHNDITVRQLLEERNRLNLLP